MTRGNADVPTGGKVYVDANVVIYGLEQVLPYWPLLRPLWAAAAAGTFNIESSELLAVEAPTGPLKTNNSGLCATYERMLFAGGLRLRPVTLPVLKKAAEIRAGHGLKTPDAIHAATAMTYGCTLFLTNDGAFRRVAGLAVSVLSEVLATP